MPSFTIAIPDTLDWFICCEFWVVRKIDWWLKWSANLRITYLLFECITHFVEKVSRYDTPPKFVSSKITLMFLISIRQLHVSQSKLSNTYQVCCHQGNYAWIYLARFWEHGNCNNICRKKKILKKKKFCFGVEQTYKTRLTWCDKYSEFHLGIVKSCKEVYDPQRSKRRLMISIFSWRGTTPRWPPSLWNVHLLRTLASWNPWFWYWGMKTRCVFTHSQSSLHLKSLTSVAFLSVCSSLCCCIIIDKLRLPCLWRTSPSIVDRKMFLEQTAPSVKLDHCIHQFS